MADLWRLKGEQFFDSSGNPLAGGKLTYFDAGTSNARTVYQDSGAATAWASPIVLDANGRLTASIYIASGSFKEKLVTSANVEVYTEDNIPGAVEILSGEYARPKTPVLAKATSYTATSDDVGKEIQFDTTGAAVILTLPSAVTAASGGKLFVKVTTGGNLLTIAGASQTVNGAASISIGKNHGLVDLTSDGSNWTASSPDLLYAALSKTTAYTVVAGDQGKTIKADATAAAFTITLPPAATAKDGFEITVQKVDASANAVTLDGNSAETINGAATVTLDKQWMAAQLRCDGSNWQIIAKTFASSTSDLTTNLVNLLVPVGAVIPYAGTSEPAGWLFCYGQAISRTTYAALFAVVGTTYGAGDGSTTFKLPDLQGRVAAGRDNMGGSTIGRITNAVSGFDGTTLGAEGGSQSHTLITAEMPSHTHNATVSNNGLHSHDIGGANDAQASAGSGNRTAGALSNAASASAGEHNHTVTIESTGGGSAHRNVQPTLILNYIIKAH